MHTILVVDDHEDTNNLICRLLLQSGHRCVQAFTVTSAFSMLESERPSMVILDWMMPDMDGMELLKAVRADPRTAQLPVVVHSALIEAKYVQHAMKKGASDYWQKGQYNPSDLPARIAAFLPELAT